MVKKKKVKEKRHPGGHSKKVQLTKWFLKSYYYLHLAPSSSYDLNEYGQGNGTFSLQI